MSAKSDALQNRIEFPLEKKIDVAKKEVEHDIEYTKNNLAEGNIPSGVSIIEVIRRMRKSALGRFRDIKMWLNISILDAIGQTTEIEDIKTLDEKTREMHAIEVEKLRAENEIRRISEKDLKLDKFNLFLLYGDQGGLKKKLRGQRKDHESQEGSQDDVQTERMVTAAAAQAYKKYENKKLVRIIIGVIVTLLCAAADYSIIYSVFLASNLTTSVSMRTAIIGAVALDLPPYILGFLLSKKDDSARLWHFRGASDDPGAKSETAGYKRAIVILLIAIIIIFLAYLILRILRFLGGGNFDAALHSVFSGNFEFKQRVFDSSDLLSTFIPFATSAGAFAVGILLSSSYTDYVSTAIMVIERKLDYCQGKCEETIRKCEKRTEGIAKEITELKQSIWTFYKGPKARLPEDDTDFIAGVADAYMELGFPLYREAYQSGAASIRDEAEKSISNINRQLSPHITDHNAISSMEISDKEQEILDEIWVTQNRAVQHSSTEDVLKEITDYIERYRRMQS